MTVPVKCSFHLMSRENLHVYCLRVFWCQVLLEPYARAYYFGSERVSKRYGTEPEQDSCSYKDIKAMCEQPFSGEYLLYSHSSQTANDLVQNACPLSALRS